MNRFGTGDAAPADQQPIEAVEARGRAPSLTLAYHIVTRGRRQPIAAPEPHRDIQWAQGDDSLLGPDGVPR